MSTSSSFDNFFFTSNLTEFVCPGFQTVRCPPPQACARDIRTGATYCCDAKSVNNPKMGRVCWSIGTPCANDGTTKLCGDGDNTWCCLSKTFVFSLLHLLVLWASDVVSWLILRVDDSETCTGNSGQKNNCWNNAHDTLADIDRQVLNETYLSLSSARPRMSSWTFDPATLIAATQTTSSSSASSTTLPSVSATSSDPPTSSSSSPPSQQISGGAIGGIVVGVVALIALAVGLGVFFSRRRKQHKRAELPGESMYKDDGGVKVELSSQPRPQELSTDPPLAELEGGK